MAHEVAHVVPVRKVYEPADTPRIREVQQKLLAESFENRKPEPGTAADVHDWKFIRTRRGMSTTALGYSGAPT